MRIVLMAVGWLAVAAVSCSNEVSDSSGNGGSGASSGGSSGTGGSGATGGGAAGAGGAGGSGVEGCTSHGECKLFQDCCDCYAVPVGSDPDICQMACEVEACDVAGATTATCQYGTCTVGKAYSCNPADAMCYGVPPVCDAGDLPEVEDECWTQECVPAWLCDVVPDCTYCLEEEICVRSFLDGPSGPWHSCRAIPVGCTGVPDCGCASLICDEGGFATCTDIPGGIYCGF